MKAIANSNPQKAITKANGTNPTKVIINPFPNILYVNPLRITNSRCPAIMFAANLKPKDIFLAR